MGRSQHSFAQIPSVNVQRSAFNRSHNVKSTFDVGLLIPFYIDEVLPGDTFKLKATLFARLATPIVPILDNMYLDTFFFYVPNRLLWEHWEQFNGAQYEPGDPTDYLIPVLKDFECTAESLFDYFGIPLGPNISGVNALPFRAYNLIFDEWFRDQNIDLEAGVPRGDGPDDTGDYYPTRRNKRHDYFTSALPWPQKGPGVEIPLGGTAPLIPSGATPQHLNLSAFVGQGYEQDFGGTTASWTQVGTQPRYTPNIYSVTPGPSGTPTPPTSSPRIWGADLQANVADSLVADLTHATAATINSLRQAFQLQRLYERDARGGTRYIEILQSHFGVISPDARLQRPEYLGGSSSRIHINPVQQTSATNTTSPQGNLAAYGVCGDTFHGFSRSFVEHGYIIGLVEVRADLTYQQGLNRMWSRQTRFDFYWPSLAHLGEQALYNREIYYQDNAHDAEVFGYQERWAEYRYYPNQICGKFRSGAPQPLDIWHLSQYFTELPTLSLPFIEDNPPVDRILAVPSEPHILFDAWIDLQCVRPMPVYSVPGLIDHF